MNKIDSFTRWICILAGMYFGTRALFSEIWIISILFYGLSLWAFLLRRDVEG